MNCKSVFSFDGENVNFNLLFNNNAFAYFTEIAKRGFAKGWNKLHPKKYGGTISMNSGDGIYSI